MYFNAAADMCVALEVGKIDAYVVDETVARILTAEHTDERILVTLEQFAYGVAFDSDCEAY